MRKIEKRRLSTLAIALCAGLAVVSMVPPATDAVGATNRQKIVDPKGYTPAPKTRESERGRAAYFRLKCDRCHTIDGKGGVAGPLLDGVGARRSARFLADQLTDPQKLARDHPELKGWERSWMPHPAASQREIASLVAFLLTLPEPAGGISVGSHDATVESDDTPDAHWSPHPVSDLSAEGRKLYFNTGCAACHAIGRFGGSLGPRLDGIGFRHSRAFVEAHISNPALHAQKAGDVFPDGSVMPTLELTEHQRKAIAEFLLTLPDAGDLQSNL